MPAYGRPQVRSDSGDHMSMIDFIDLGVSRWHEDGSGSGSQRRVDVTANVADQQAFTGSEAELSGGRGHHSRLGFAATAVGIGRMRANLPGVEGTEQRLHSGIDPSKLIGIDQPAGDAGLVAHYPDCDALASELVKGTPGSRYWLDSPRVGEIGHVFDQGSVSVEEHGAGLPGGSWLGAPSSQPDPEFPTQPMRNCKGRNQEAAHQHAADLGYGPGPGRNAASGELSGQSHPHQTGCRCHQPRNAP
jgi:hypothetical protein